MNRLKSALVAGVLVMVPLLATAGVVRWLVQSLDRAMRGFLPSAAAPVDFPGLGLAMFLVLLVVAGLLAQNFLGNALLNGMDHLLRRVTFVGSIYGAIRKLLETVLSPGDDRFHGVVLVPFPREGMYSIGFRTGTPEKKLTGSIPEKLVSVFVPCTPNPTSGFYILAKETDLVPLHMTVQEAFGAVLSMGLVGGEKAVHTPVAKGTTP